MYEPAVNPDVNDMADQVKHGYAVVTEKLAAMQYRLAELAGTGQLDVDVAMELQHDLVDLWEKVYWGTLCAVRDQRTPDDTWDEADNTYSDGRTITTKIRLEPYESSVCNWDYNRFLLGAGAIDDYPRGMTWTIAPVNLIIKHPRFDGPRPTDFEALRKRLRPAANSWGEYEDTESADGDDDEG